MSRKGQLCTHVGADQIKCGRNYWKRGYCSVHCKRMLAGGDMDAPIQKYTRNQSLSCSLSGCLHKARARGLCQSHVRRYYDSKLAGTLEDGRWRRPLVKRRADCEAIRIKMPRVEMERLKAYAELRGLSIEDTIVEAALRNIAEWRMRAA